ncbi:hypothetical protein BY458DRAFT_466724 [Sporodiniella umbellata]|nr:hypothetical protein BY458DRAFT_466724 [Sporodiniella umbellata]
MEMDSTNKRNSLSHYLSPHRHTEPEEAVSRRNSMYQTSEFIKRSSRRGSLQRSYRNSFLNEDDLDDPWDGEGEDWELVLRQYDRYGTEEKGKRNSRLFESYPGNNNNNQGRGEFVSIHPAQVQVPPAEEPTTILDCFDFPSTFQTQDLHNIFCPYEEMRGGYKIKWLSDTRALILFEHPATAKKAYLDQVVHPLTHLTPYRGPTDFLKDRRASYQSLSDRKRQSFYSKT